jgi:putative oxidoreductase
MLIRRVARPLLAGIFIFGGLGALRDPKGHAELIGPVVEPVLDGVAGMIPVERPPSAVTLVQVDAGIKIGAGVLLATGKMPRLAATALTASLIPTTALGHRFWEMDDSGQRMNHQIQFLKNLGLLGGLLLAVADKPSQARPAKRTSAELSRRDATEGVGALSRRAGALSGQAADLAGKAGERLTKRTKRLRVEAERLGAKAAKRAEKAAKRAHKAGKRAQKVSRKASRRLRAQL